MTVLVGSRRPRLFTPPLQANGRGLPRYTRGAEFVRFAKARGEPCWPWQVELAYRGLECDEAGRLRFRIVVVIVARQNGKTRFLRLLAEWLLFECGARLVVAAAQDRARAFEVWEEALETIEADPVYSERLGKVWRRTNAEYFRVLDEEGRPAGFYRIKAATRSSGRGPSSDLVLLDELREQTDDEGWAALSKTTMARANGQVWAFSNAGDRKAVVLRRLRKVALAGEEPSIGIFEWSAPAGCAMDDRQGWVTANPSLGQPGGITEGAIRTAMASDTPEVFRTEVLCQFVDTMIHAVDPDGWRDCADPSLNEKRKDWIACIDVAPDSAHVSLVLAAVLLDGRVRIEAEAAWETKAGLPATEHARQELDDLLKAIRPRKVVWFPSGPAKPLGALLRAWKAVELTGAKASEACMTLADLTDSRRLVHADDPLLTAHVLGASKHEEGEGWRFTRLEAGHCDAAYAAAGAVRVALELGARRPLRLIVPSDLAMTGS